MFNLSLLSVSLVLLAWLITSRIPPRHLRNPSLPPLVNYDATVYFDPDRMESPSTKEEILQIVSRAIESGRQIRVVGSGHSRTKIAHSDDVMLSLHKYKGIFKLDAEKKQVTVKAGTILSDIVQYLDTKGLALSSLPAITDQSIAGAISTGSHGTGVHFGNIATFVTKLELITGEGESLTLSADNHPDIFKAAQVSVGLLGIITKVTLQCEPAFNLEETLEYLSLDQCIEDLDKLARSAQHVKLWMEYSSRSCAVIRMNRTTSGVTETSDMRILDLKMRLMEPFLYLTSWIPSYTPSIMRFIDKYINVFSRYSRVEKSFKVFVPPLYFPSNKQAEVAVDMDRCAEAVKLQLALINSSSAPVNHFSEIRFVDKDDIWLSPNFHRESCHLTLMLYNPSHATMVTYFESLYTELLRLNFKPRVHFGKYFNVQSKEVSDVVPLFHDFMQLRANLDPNEIFLNRAMRDAFVTTHKLFA